jgi:hypothetical protein
MAATEDTSAVLDAATLGKKRTDHSTVVKSLFCSKMIISRPEALMQHTRRLPSLVKGAGFRFELTFLIFSE